MENWSVLWVRKTKDLLKSNTCLWLVFSVQWGMLLGIEIALSNCQWLMIPSRPHGNLSAPLPPPLPLAQNAESWAGKRVGKEEPPDRYSCLDRMETESCVRVWSMTLRARRSPVPFWGELSPLQFHSVCAWSSVSSGGQTGHSQGLCVVASSSPLAAGTGAETVMG